MKTVCAGIGGYRLRGRGRKVFLWALAIGAGLAQVALSGLARAEDQQQPKRVTFAFEELAAADAIMQLRWLADVPIVFQPPPDVRINLSVMEVPLDRALTALCDPLGYEWMRVGSIYVLRPAQREPLLPAPDPPERFLYTDLQRLDAARLILALDSDQLARVSQGQALTYPELSPAQQRILSDIYTRLITAARREWIPGAERLSAAPATLPPSLAFSIRGYTWRIAQPPARPQPAPAPTPEQQPEPAPEE